MVGQKKFLRSEVSSTQWLITSELANQRARKVLFICVVYTKHKYTTRGGNRKYAKHVRRFHNIDPPISTRYLREVLGVILTENSFEFNEKNSKPMVLQWAQRQQCPIANIFMAEIETEI